jgi:hypothetical protein
MVMEILKKVLVDNEKTYISARSEVRDIYIKYKDSPCVIAYKKCFMGCVLLIKGERGFFGFTFLNSNYGNNSYSLTRKWEDDIYSLLGDDSIVCDEMEFQIFKNKMALRKIAREK